MEWNVKLRRLRRMNELSQRDVATKMEVSQAMISHFEQGRTEPSIEMMKKFASLYNSDATTIFLDDSDKLL